MTPDERDRLKAVEVKQTQISDDVKAIRKDVAEVKSAMTKAGGIFVGASAVAAFFGWLVAKGSEFAAKIGIGN